ncbi:MAG TPA: transketolase C-terminal domain-containing protein [Clostridiales bacterium]|jgi:transketolase|nr:transketolase C-terminal domain-containing protein [Clostridiales bacterium]HQP70493.1 transketolase C-terminal domain-containing protein [Clostridiales bacterium]
MTDIKEEKTANRFGYSDALLDLIEIDKNIIALDADLAKSTTTFRIKEKYPDNFIDVGIAEQNLIGIAAGLSLNGHIPFVSTYAAFVAGRAFDQIRTTVCYSNLNVKLAGMHVGITVGADGPTHQMLEDIALMRVLPNMIILNPCDVNEAYNATVQAYKHKGPVYIRFVREATPILTSREDEFVIGKAKILRQGKDITVVSSGQILSNVIEACKMLEKEGFDIELINVHTIKPLDVKCIADSVRKTGKLFVVDEHQIHGGLGTAVFEALMLENIQVRSGIIAVNDTFLTSGSPDELLEKYGFSSVAVKYKIQSFY